MQSPPQDGFYRRAKDEQFRARSAYKLLHVHEITRILDNVVRAVDLCAAPGSWSQLLSRMLYAPLGIDPTKPLPEDCPVRIVAVDLQEMAPIPRVQILQGDITELKTAQEIVTKLDGHHAQLVICDGAPDVTGLHEADEFLHSQLIFAALGTAARVLEKGGNFVAKIFRNEGLDLMRAQFHLLFDAVEVIKPSSSRIRSAEHFIVGLGFKYEPGELDFLSLSSSATCGTAANATGPDLQMLRGMLLQGSLSPPCESGLSSTGPSHSDATTDR